MRDDLDDSAMQPNDPFSSSSVDSVVSSTSARADVVRSQWLEMRQAPPLDFNQILAQLNRAVPTTSSKGVKGRAPRAQPEDVRISDYGSPMKCPDEQQPPPVPPRRESRESKDSKKASRPSSYHQYDQIVGSSIGGTSNLNRHQYHYRSAENIYDVPKIMKRHRRNDERGIRKQDEGIRLMGNHINTSTSLQTSTQPMQRSYSSIVYKPNEGAVALDSSSSSSYLSKSLQPGMRLVENPRNILSKSGEVPITRVVTAHLAETEPVRVAKIQKIPRIESSLFQTEPRSSHDHTVKPPTPLKKPHIVKSEKPPNPIVKELEEFLSKPENTSSKPIPPIEMIEERSEEKSEEDKEATKVGEEPKPEPIHEKPRTTLTRPPKLQKRASSCDESNLEKNRQDETNPVEGQLRQTSSHQDMNALEAIYNRLQRLRGRADPKQSSSKNKDKDAAKHETKEQSQSSNDTHNRRQSLGVEKSEKEPPPKPPRSPTIGQLLLQNYMPKKLSTSTSLSPNPDTSSVTPDKSPVEKSPPPVQPSLEPNSAAPTIVAPQFRVFRHSLSTPDMLEGIRIPGVHYPEPEPCEIELKNLSKEERLKEGTEALGRLLKKERRGAGNDRPSSSASEQSRESTTTSEKSRESSQTTSSKSSIPATRKGKPSLTYPKLTATVPMLPELPEERELSASRLQEDREIGISLRDLPEARSPKSIIVRKSEQPKSLEVKIIEHDVSDSSGRRRSSSGSGRRGGQTTHSTVTVRSNSHKLQIEDWEELLQSDSRSQSSEEEVLEPRKRKTVGEIEEDDAEFSV